MAVILTVAGAAWFLRTHGVGRRRLRHGGALLVTTGAICVAGCGHAVTRRR